MPLWGKSDAASNTPLYALSQVSTTANSDNQTALFGNTTSNTYLRHATIGLFGADAGEVQAQRAAGKPVRTPGWNLVTTIGSRVRAETLVALKTLSTDASDDTVMPDYKLSITSQPAGNTANTTAGQNATFTVVAASVPAGATLSYSWTYANGDAIQAGANVGVKTAASLVVNSAVQTSNASFKVAVSATGAATVTSSNATLTITT